MSTDKYATVKIGDHVINTTDGSRVEFITDDGKTILVHANRREGCEGNPSAQIKGDPQELARPILVGDGTSERKNVFQNWVILPGPVDIDGKVLRNSEGLEANGIAFYAEESRLVPTYPAVYWYKNEATKLSPVVYRTEGRTKNRGFVISEIKVNAQEPEPQRV